MKGTRMLEASDLWKSFGDRTAVAGVSLGVKAGETLGLLGPNGAGKSTTVAMLCGLLRPDRGEVRVAGQPMAGEASPLKRRIGVAPQELALYEDLSALANLELFGALYGLAGGKLRERSRAALALVGLADRAKDKPASFSGGMKRRLNIACALVHDPDVLLLDEPTVGVDPQSRNAIFENLEDLRRAGKALVYTTHYMEEAERLCDRVVIVDHGRVIASGTVPELHDLLPAAQTLEIDVEGEVDLVRLEEETGLAPARANGRLTLPVPDLAAGAAKVLAELSRQGIRTRAIGSGRASLEAVFLALTGHELRD
jgi:ABC-2 type transport system ATP-binding protein